MTIPRLELMATLIGARSLRFIKNELGIEDKQMILWTDSQCVLDWLKQKENRDVFVRNRVKEITSENDIVFRYVNTEDNKGDTKSVSISLRRGHDGMGSTIRSISTTLTNGNNGNKSAVPRIAGA